MSDKTATPRRIREPFDVRPHPLGYVIMSGPTDNDVILGAVYDKGPGSGDAEEMAKVWAASYQIMFPALAEIRDMAREAINDGAPLALGTLRDIADVAANALPVPTIGDVSGTAPEAPRRSSVQEAAPATAADGLTETAIDLTTYEGDPAAILALLGAVPPDQAPANRLVVVVVDRGGEEGDRNEYQLSMQDSARYDVTLGHRSEASDDWETVGWNWEQDHFGSGGRRVVAAFPDAGLAEIDNPALLGRLSAARAVAPAGVPEGVVVPAEANTAIRARAESRAIDFGLDFDKFGGDESIDALYRAMVSGGNPAAPSAGEAK